MTENHSTDCVARMPAGAGECPKCSDEARRLERAACERFLALYNERNGTHFRTIEHRQRNNPPDFLVKDEISEISVGIEIKQLYYDSNEAKMLLGRQPERGLESLRDAANMIHENIIGELSRLLQKACNQEKKYEFAHETILLIRPAGPFFDTSTFDIFKDDIICPPGGFKEIWLLLSDPSSINEWTELRCLRK